MTSSPASTRPRTRPNPKAPKNGVAQKQDTPAPPATPANPQPDAARPAAVTVADPPPRMDTPVPATPLVSPPPSPGAPTSPTPPPTRLIAFMNQKGGVGKTTTAVNLGAALADAGKNVLLIDMDPQAHLTLHLGIEPTDGDHTVYDLITDSTVSALQVLHQVNERLAVLPAEVSLAGVEAELAPKMITGRAQVVLKQKCGELIRSHEGIPMESGQAPARRHEGGQKSGGDFTFDFVLIDCPPSLGLLTVNALTLATEVVVPMQAQFLALQGLSQLMETVGMIQQSFNAALKVCGIVLCMHEPQTILATEVMADLNGFLESARGQNVPWCDAQVLEPPIRRNIKLAECPGFGQTIFDYAPTSRGAGDYRRLAQSLVEQGSVAVKT